MTWYLFWAEDMGLNPLVRTRQELAELLDSGYPLPGMTVCIITAPGEIQPVDITGEPGAWEFAPRVGARQ